MFPIKARPYTAAVVEYSPKGNVFSQTPAEVLGQNLNNYKQLIVEAASLVKFVSQFFRRRHLFLIIT
jgi:hypothetical protein